MHLRTRYRCPGMPIGRARVDSCILTMAGRDVDVTHCLKVLLQSARTVTGWLSVCMRTHFILAFVACAEASDSLIGGINRHVHPVWILDCGGQTP